MRLLESDNLLDMTLFDRSGTIISVLIWLGVFQMAEALMIKTFRSRATGLILSLCNEIKLVEHINHSVTWDEKRFFRNERYQRQSLALPVTYNATDDSLSNVFASRSL